MPFAGYNNWEDCYTDQKLKGQSEDSAKRICGYLKSRLEDNSEFTDITPKELDYIGKEFSKYVYQEYSQEEITLICDKCGMKMKSLGMTKLKVPLNTDIKKYLTEMPDNEIYYYNDIEAEIFAVGTWNKDTYTKQDLESLVQNFYILKDVVKPPAKIGHSEKQELLHKEGLPAAGWVEEIKLVGNKLIAKFKDVPKVIKDLIDKKAYRRISAEIYPQYKNPKDGKVYKNVLRAVAFLGGDIPAIETLSDIKALYNDIQNKFKIYILNVEDLKKGGGDTQMKNKKFVVYAKNGDTLENIKKKFEDETDIEVTAPDDQLSPEETKTVEEKIKKAITEATSKLQEELLVKENTIAELQRQLANTGTKVNKEELEKQVSEFKAEIEMFANKLKESETEKKKLIAEMVKFKEDIRDKTIVQFVDTNISEGKILPKDKEKIVAFMKQFDDKEIVKYSVDGTEITESKIEMLKMLITAQPKVVEFTEIAPQVEHTLTKDKLNIGGVQYNVQNIDLVQKAEKFAQENNITFDKALVEVTKTM